MNKRYIVRDKNGNYQSAYNLSFGKQKAYQWAVDCAKNVNGIVYYSDDDDKQMKELEVYRVPDNHR
jgi:hypothetical protein